MDSNHATINHATINHATINNTYPDLPLGHQGESEMQRRFPSRYQWNEQSIKSLIRPEIIWQMAQFIEAQPFFFIATANDKGHCDASFKGTEASPQGELLPACRVVSEKIIIFPDYSGNGLYNSLGNIHSNPHIGMIFIDFNRKARVRVNGKAFINNVDDNIKSIWPKAQAYVQVDVEQVYGNCPARIPQRVVSNYR